MVLTDDVLSPDHAIGEFICKICMQLSDHPVYTHCTHVFCESCLDEWFQHKRSCPSCNASLSHDQVGPLQTANPLAWRLLGRVQLRCPLHAQSCTWKGDYSEVCPSQLQSADARSASAPLILSISASLSACLSISQPHPLVHFAAAAAIYQITDQLISLLRCTD